MRKKSRLYNSAIALHHTGYDAYEEDDYYAALFYFDLCKEVCGRFKRAFPQDSLVRSINEMLTTTKELTDDMDRVQLAKGLLRYRDAYVPRKKLREVLPEIELYQEMLKETKEAYWQSAEAKYKRARKLYLTIQEKAATFKTERRQSALIPAVESLTERCQEGLERVEDALERVHEMEETKRADLREAIKSLERKPISLDALPERITMPERKPDNAMSVIDGMMAEGCIQKAMEYQAAGDIEAALNELGKVAREFPDSEMSRKAIDKCAAMFLQGSIGRPEGPIQKAIDRFRKWAEEESGGLTNANDRLYAQLAIGKQLYKMGKADNALSELERFVSGLSAQTGRSDSGLREDASLLIALCCLNRGRHDDALSVLRKLASDDSEKGKPSSRKQFKARVQFLIAWTLMAQQEYTEALDEYVKVIDDYPESKYADQALKLVERLNRLIGSDR